MPLDTRIALGVQPLQLADPLAREGQVQNILASQAQQRAAGMQQQSAQMQMDQTQRQLRQDEDYVSQMADAIGKNGGPPDMEKAARLMATNRNPDVSRQGVTMLQSLQRLAAATKAGIYGAPAPVIPNAGPTPGAMGSGTFGMDQNVPMFNQRNVPPLNLTTPAVNQLTPPAAAPVNQLAATPQANAAKTLETEYMKLSQYSDLPGIKDRMALIAEQLKELRAPRVVAAGGSVYNAATNKFEQAPEKTKQTDLQVNYEYAKNQGFTGSIFDYERKLKEAGRAPAAPRPEQPPVAVVDPVTGKPVYVTREQALSGKMTPASAMEGLPPKEIQARESKFPAATSAVKTFESSAEKLATDLERLATHPGLSGISGLVYGRTPAITKDARAAQALYDSIVARGGFQELQNMRASSPTGGALGNVSNQEGQYLRDAFAPINRTQDTTDLSRSLKDAAVAARTSKQRVRDAYDMTYEYKTGGGAAPQGTGGFKYLGKE